MNDALLIFDILKSSFNLEVKNKFIVYDNELIIWFDDNSKAKIKIKM